MDFLLCSLWRGSDDPLRGMCPPAVPGQQPHPGSAGPGLPEPEAQARAGLQPLRLRPRVGAWGLATGEAEPSWSRRHQEPSRTSVFVDPLPSAPAAAALASRPGRCSASSGWQTAATWSCPTASAPPRAPPPSGPAASRGAPPSGSRQAGPRSVLRPGIAVFRLFGPSDSGSASVFGHLWKRSPEAPERLWAAGVRGRPRELLPDPAAAGRNAALLPRSVWK